MFAAIAANPTFFKKYMNLFIALAPVVYLGNVESGFIKSLADNSSLENAILNLDIVELFPAESNNKAGAFFHKILP